MSNILVRKIKIIRCKIYYLWYCVNTWGKIKNNFIGGKNYMSKEIFTVKLSPLEAQEMIEKKIGEEVVFCDGYNLGDGKFILITVYEKYYIRSNSNAGLVVVCENTSGETVVKVTSTGSGAGLFMIDWGSGNNFIKKVKEILLEYII
jgi:hypothetical protein